MKQPAFNARFEDDESGAVTVDWIVLSAAIIVATGTVLTIVTDGVETLAGDIETQMTDSDLGV